MALAPMFVFIIGNAEEKVFKIGIASDPFQKLSSLQEGNPYKLSILCKICVGSKNEASLVEQLARKELREYEGAGEWYTTVPTVISTQFASDHYLRLLASKKSVRVRTQQNTPKGRANLQRLTPIAKSSELLFEDVLKKVTQAYDEGISIDKLFE